MVISTTVNRMWQIKGVFKVVFVTKICFFWWVGSFSHPVRFLIVFSRIPAGFEFITGQRLEFIRQVTPFWKLDFKGYKIKDKPKNLETRFIFLPLPAMRALSAILSVLTSDAFSLFTLIFVLLTLNLHIWTKNADLCKIFTRQLCI